ncbi:bromodomain adjacent to zinc finger domain protein 2B isoform X3 [Hermetia illucens]|uniref:bromodomain adjacent to zinc finger domain protein 2B isoform X3 n=1 Tax=Hermetia illucens TaxID=343691 RepID=UPI0018CBF364|nr:bromodomain adjacent to zinc finger domain protein 2B isoform X3 [Hermetia illucens]
MGSMDKNGDASSNENKSRGDNKSGSGGAHDPSALLDAASLFAYWGREPSAAAAAAASNSLFSSQFGAAAAAGLGLLPNPNSNNDRYSMAAAAAAAAGHHHQNTMAVAASQAASLAGLHPAASWWSMAQLAAQDYFSRLQASGLSPFPHPDLAAAFPQALGMGGASGSTGGGNSGSNNSRSNNSSNHSSNGSGNTKSGSGKGRKERKQSINSMVASNAANLAALGSGTTITPTSITSSVSSSYKSNSSYSKSSSLSSGMSNNPVPISAYNHANLHKELLAMQAAAASAAAVSSKKSSHHQQQHHSGMSGGSGTAGNSSSGGSSNTKSSLSHHHSISNSSHSSLMSSNSGSNRSSSKDQIDKSNPSASLNALTSLSQLGSLGLSSPQGVQAAMNALAANTGKVKDYMPSGILSAALEGNDPSSLLGVRLPPDTEIIKYTSSIVGPKIPGTTNRGRKKTISLDPNPLLAFPGLSPAKRARLEMEYAAAVGQAAAAAAAVTAGSTGTGSGSTSGNTLPSAGNDRVEVIKLPPTITSNGAYNLSSKSTGKDIESDTSGTMNLTMKSSTNSSCADDNDAPLNLSMKPDNKNSSDYSNMAGANSLQSLSSITAALGSGSGSGNSSSDRSSSSYKEGRPRNLGRGVSKPKKNTVASLLAQSRAVGLKPMLTPQQLMNQGADLEKIRQALSDAQVELSTDSESVAAESGLSESEGEDTQVYNIPELRKPLELGWKRETIIRGLTKNGQMRGDVYYYAPGGTTKLKTIGQILTYLDKNPSKLTRDNFSFSARAIVGSFLQPAPPLYANDGEYIRMADTDVAKRLEELRIFTRHSLNVEQRIEIARQQQALRDAKKLAKEEMARNKEKARQERNEKLETQRKERELKNQQALEARRKRQEEIERQKQEELIKKQQEKEKKRQEAILAKEQERERRRQHMSLIRQLENRRKFEERERKKHQIVLDRLIQREKRAAAKRRDADILAQIRKPQEDSEIANQKEMPVLQRISGCRLPGQAMADLLMVFEFLHNFGETLGFDMESLPTLQSLHDALANENAIEAEEELLSVMTHLLVCAIEDPGIPNPGRHTTLLGQSLRNADLTNANISEVLRIYLYAAATGEVRQLTGVTLDREKEKRIADHHQYDIDCLNVSSTKNHQYYELLHENTTWKLSMCLKDKPFVALNPTKKAEILAHLCNDLLLNKAVLKQIEGSLESCAQYKREKYLNDMKVRKYKSLHMRKLRMEAYEKAQQQQQEREAAAVAAQSQSEPQRKESTDTETENNNNQETSTSTVEKMEVDENTQQSGTAVAAILPNHKDESETETLSEKLEESPVKSGDTTPVKNAKTEECATYQNGTPATPELNHILNKKINSRDDASTDVGLDDDLSDVESEITTVEEDEDNRMTSEEVQKKLEKLIKTSEQSKEFLERASNQLRATCYGQDRYWRRYWKLPKAGAIFVEAMESAQNEILEYHKILEEEFKKQAEDDAEVVENDTAEDVKPQTDEITDEPKEEPMEDGSLIGANPCSPLPPPPPPPLNHSADERDESLNMVVDTRNDSGIEENDKLDDDVCDSITVKSEVKQEPDVLGDDMIKPEVAIEKWFSILNREMPLTAPEQHNTQEYQKLFSNVVCESQIQIQGNRWDISNNVQYFTVPLENGKIDLHFRNESILSLSGLDEQLVEGTVTGEEGVTEHKLVEEDVMQIKAGRIDLRLDEATGIPMTSLANMSLGNISTYVACDVPTPLSMTAEEHRLLERIKDHGFPKKIEKNFVAGDLRYGWWKIDALELVNDVIQSLHQRGVRERELRLNLLRSINDALDLSTSCPIVAESNEEDAGPGFVEPDSPTGWNARVAKRVELALLEQVEALEDKIASASMQVKHWQLPTRNESDINLTEVEDITMEDFVSIIPMIRERIESLESAIERRYLKPPLGNISADAHLAAIAQNQHHQQTSTSSSSLTSSTLSLQLQNSDSNQQNNGGLASTTTSNSAAESPSSVCSSEKDLGIQEHMPKGLITWRDAVARSHTTSQLAMALYVLESCVAWDKSIMKAKEENLSSDVTKIKILLQQQTSKNKKGDQASAKCTNWRLLQNCQFCTSGENEDKLLLCDSCDKGYHTYCFKPKMDNIPEGDWYCFECVNKATNERKCIVCGGLRPPPVGKMVYCELCPRAYHQDCCIPPLLKVPRGKWYCHGCISKAPPPKKRPPKKPKEKTDKESKSHNSTAATPTTMNSSHEEPTVPLSPALSVASTSFDDHQNSIDGRFGSQSAMPTPATPSSAFPATVNTSTPAITPTQIPPRPASPSNSDILETSLDSTSNSQLQTVQSQSQQSQSGSTMANTSSSSQLQTPQQSVSPSLQQMQQQIQPQQSSHQQLQAPSQQQVQPQQQQAPPSNAVSETKDKDKLKQEKKEKHATKKLMKELAICKTILNEMELHEDSWPFLLPVNTKQFPTYKKIIKTPMDLSTIRKRIQDLTYKSREDFCVDVRQIFDNCEMFNEDDSPVGKAGHGMRKFFEVRWAELTDKHS